MSSPSIKSERSASVPSSNHDQETQYLNGIYNFDPAIDALARLRLDNFTNLAHNFEPLRLFAEELNQEVADFVTGLTEQLEESITEALLPVRGLLDLYGDTIWSISTLGPWLSQVGSPEYPRDLTYRFGELELIAKHFGMLVLDIVETFILQRSREDRPTVAQMDEIDGILLDFYHFLCNDKYPYKRSFSDYQCFAGRVLDPSYSRVTDLDPRIWRGDFADKERRVDGYRSWNKIVSNYFHRLEISGAGKPWKMMEYMATTDPAFKVQTQDIACIACKRTRFDKDAALGSSSTLTVRPEKISWQGISRGIMVCPITTVCAATGEEREVVTIVLYAQWPMIKVPRKHYWFWRRDGGYVWSGPYGLLPRKGVKKASG